MANSSGPDLEIAKRALPYPLLQALRHMFAQGLKGCVLAGGTSLAGFYAGHRRSDDIGLFTIDLSHQRSAVLAIESLGSIGAALEIENRTAQYFESLARLEGHQFKITSVVDRSFFNVGRAIELTDSLRVADLETLFKMKAATLVSRCREKGLYDLIWLFNHFRQRTFADLIRLGSEIDGGVDGEAVLASVSGTILRKEACDFSRAPEVSAGQIYAEIIEFKKRLIRGITAYLENGPTPPLGELVQKLARLADP